MRDCSASRNDWLRRSSSRAALTRWRQYASSLPGSGFAASPFASAGFVVSPDFAAAGSPGFAASPLASAGFAEASEGSGGRTIFFRSSFVYV